MLSGVKEHGIDTSWCTDVLRFILNCPEELPFLDAFTLHEYHDVFAHSYPAQALKNAKSPDEDWRKVLERIPHDAEPIIYNLEEDELIVCLNCFRPIYRLNLAQPCVGCGNLVHSGCFAPRQLENEDVPRSIHLWNLDTSSLQPKTCAVCRDKSGWERWTESPGPPLSGDYPPSEEQMDGGLLESRLKRIEFQRDEVWYDYNGTWMEPPLVLPE